MAPGVCVTSFRMLMRRSELGHLRSRGLCLLPAGTSKVNSWSIRDRNYCTDKWMEEAPNSGSKSTNSKPASLPSGPPSGPPNPQGSTASLPAQDLDFSKLKVAELKRHLREHGLSVGGKKEVLLRRLQDYLHDQKQLPHRDQHRQPDQPRHHQCHREQHTVRENSVQPHDRPAPAEPPTTPGREAETPWGGFPATELPVEMVQQRAGQSGQPSSELAQCEEDVTVEYIQGLPHLTVPLPSRNEKCRFALKPVSHKVGDLLEMLKMEDRGIDRATVLNKCGVRIASTCNIESLMDEPFWLHINDLKYKVVPPTREKIASEDISKLGDIRALVAQLYEALHVGEYHIEKEHELAAKLEDLKYQVTPMEQQKAELSMQAQRRTNVMTWVGLGLMSVQFGILARLTWWEYSWDIMEPVTYFVTYGTAMACYAYFCITKQDYTLPEVKDRQYLLTLHKRAKKKNFDIDQYNSLKRQIADIEYDLRRLRDPLNLQLPPHIDRSQTGAPPAPKSDSGTLISKVTDDKSKTGFRIPFLEPKN